jgi:hypothetical protein
LLAFVISATGPKTLFYCGPVYLKTFYKGRNSGWLGNRQTGLDDIAIIGKLLSEDADGPDDSIDRSRLAVIASDRDALYHFLKTCAFPNTNLSESCQSHVYNFGGEECPLGTFNEPLALCYKENLTLDHGYISAINETITPKDLLCVVNGLYRHGMVLRRSPT